MENLKYKDGLALENLNHIKELSSYNRNYYVGIGTDLIYAESDDDNTTEWYLLKNMEFVYLGESYSTEGDLLNRYETRCT